jgi:hypothetical protein
MLWKRTYRVMTFEGTGNPHFMATLDASCNMAGKRGAAGRAPSGRKAQITVCVGPAKVRCAGSSLIVITLERQGVRCKQKNKGE